jgi:hypothetical protein
MSWLQTEWLGVLLLLIATSATSMVAAASLAFMLCGQLAAACPHTSMPVAQTLSPRMHRCRSAGLPLQRQQQ